MDWLNQFLHEFLAWLHVCEPLISEMLLISILPKNHADGDKWLVTKIKNFTSI